METNSNWNSQHDNTFPMYVCTCTNIVALRGQFLTGSSREQWLAFKDQTNKQADIKKWVQLWHSAGGWTASGGLLGKEADANGGWLPVGRGSVTSLGRRRGGRTGSLSRSATETEGNKMNMEHWWRLEVFQHKHTHTHTHITGHLWGHYITGTCVYFLET